MRTGMSHRYRFCLVGRMTLASLATISLISCAKSDGILSRATDKPAPPEPTADFTAEMLDGGGCLSLQKFQAALDAAPSGTLARHYTRDFKMSETGTGGESVRKNFASISGFGQFHYVEHPADIIGLSLGKVVQNACESVEVSDDIMGTVKYKVQSVATAPNELHLARLIIDPVDNQEKPDGFEVHYLLKGPRELESRTVFTMMDPCPPWQNAKAERISTFAWGTNAELEKTPIEISRAYLKSVSGVVSTMPTSLMSIVLHETSDWVATQASDLVQLRSATLDSGLQRCPYVARNPEAPNPTQPTPTPTPAPTPAVTTAPGATPDPNATPAPATPATPAPTASPTPAA